MGDVILSWRKWYCLGEEDICVLSEWKDGEPTFGDYLKGKLSYTSDGTTYMRIEGFEANSESYAKLSYNDRLSEYII